MSAPIARCGLWLAPQRAGTALPSYLALLHAGFAVPPMLPPERWALTPPFHPYQMSLPLEDVPEVFLGPVTEAERTGGLFSVALSVADLAPGLSPTLRRPPGVTRRVTLRPDKSGQGVRTFLQHDRSRSRSHTSDRLTCPPVLHYMPGCTQETPAELTGCGAGEKGLMAVAQVCGTSGHENQIAVFDRVCGTS